MQQPHKYQHFEISTHIDLTEDIKQMIYDEKSYPDDLKLFNSSDWNLAPVTEKIITPPLFVPSRAYIQSKKIDPSEVDLFYGKVEMEGHLKGKSN